MHRTPGRTFVTAVVIVGLVVAPASTAAEVPVAGISVAGVASPEALVDTTTGRDTETLPVHVREPNAARLVGAGERYAMYTSPGSSYTIVDLADGSTVRTANPYRYWADVTLVDDRWTEYSATDGGYVRDAVGDATRYVGQFERLIHADDTWFLGVRTNSGLDIVFPDANTLVRADPVIADASWVGGDSSLAVLTDGTRSWALDPTTGAATELTTPLGLPLHVVAALGGEDPVALAVLDSGPVGRLVTLEEPSTNAGYHETLLQLPSAGVDTFHVFGAEHRLAAVEPADDNGARDLLLLGDGPPEPVAHQLAPGAGAVADRGDGSLVLSRVDRPTGTLSVVDGSGLVEVADVTPVELVPEYVFRSGRTVLASFYDSSDGLGYHVAEWSPDDPQWRPAFPGVWNLNQYADYGGDHLLTGYRPYYEAYTTYRLMGRDGSVHDVDAQFAELSADGRFLLLYSERDFSNGQAYRVVDTTTWDTVTSFGALSARLGEGWVWRLNGDNRLIGQRLDSLGDYAYEEVGAPCGTEPTALPLIEAVSDHWALVRCASDDRRIVVDLDRPGELGATWVVPERYPGVPIVLGPGYLAQAALPNGWDDGDNGIRVYDLATHASFQIPSAGPPRLAFDEQSIAPPVYVDQSDSRIRIAPGDWPTAPDVDAPTVDLVTASPEVAPAAAPTTVSATYGASDAHDLDRRLSVEVWARHADAGAPFGRWRSESFAGVGSAASALKPGATWCTTARARDRAGNASTPAPVRCSTVPYDDRAMRGRGPTRRLDSSALWGGTGTVLLPGGSLSRPGQRASAVVLRVVRAPGQGRVQVWIGDTRIGVVNVAAKRAGVAMVTVPGVRARVGDVRILARRGQVVVDAVAVLR